MWQLLQKFNAFDISVPALWLVYLVADGFGSCNLLSQLSQCVVCGLDVVDDEVVCSCFDCWALYNFPCLHTP